MCKITNAVVKPRYGFYSLRTRLLYRHHYLYEIVRTRDMLVVYSVTGKRSERTSMEYAMRLMNDKEVVRAEEGVTIEGDTITLVATSDTGHATKAR